MNPNTPLRRMRGFSLIELMVSLLIGLLVMGAAIGIFLSNRQAFRATENISQVQESARTAFELMARDIREAGGNPCVNNLPIANVINSPADRWWTDLQQWGTAVRGYGNAEAFPDAGFGTATAQRLAGTDAIQLLSGEDQVVTISAHNPGATQFTLNTDVGSLGFSAGDLMLACNSRQASLFQASSAGGTQVMHAAGGSPGNCSGNLGLVAEGAACSGRPVFTYAAPNSVLVRMHATRWYIANNARGRRSLYQSRTTGGAIANEEVVEGVADMEITYLLRGGTVYVDAATVAGAWGDVIATRVELTLESPENVGVDGGRLDRQLVQVTTLRNRNS
ncbi:MULTISPECIES: PilW family protein [unclassified Luteimonas]|uniref:PilW family protein n=1 Tax=unclassified Luteimonas TaxID=2629088 RepID=UPI0018F104D6|nr:MULTISPECIES: PilW family protein [unclassified Luteimonas]MBJ6978786.1 prepilin-type N-terminal cleavage/methylation domain-containing protein [Luteimonas sp. MC1895]MBJ6983686.1 prepilin-type N-terminal cleavage/methylation domain-containing protein [Luteimonas sp. MC1750]QQO06524.1 prepilin-type N-terminal cleavage/methylation domain-containing protein [Luteimonas sp. MC1750]